MFSGLRLFPPIAGHSSNGQGGRHPSNGPYPSGATSTAKAAIQLVPSDDVAARTLAKNRPHPENNKRAVP
ncbi:hypothetical protein ppKF707_5808 [Metapseudomonas furukawaii]|uniref:Uncharacterized protein n=1 Tax=Metapseudomonas furukawaii TaxID=1149133 RepID=A0AAD1BX86_METFU|nr:hypothetical protein ppKF707_5808 [Pseudomonas furukawaii]BAU72872.1 hypothetical protein KF707C_11840 [Pseudomonas furukawaii]